MNAMTNIRCFLKNYTISGLKNMKKIVFYSLCVWGITILYMLPVCAKNLTVDIGGAEMLKFPEGVAEIFIASPDIADVQLSNRHTAYVFGKKAGMTKLYAMDAKGKEILSVQVLVSMSLSQLKQMIAAYDPHELVDVKYIPGGVVLEGIVDTPKTAEDINALAHKVMGEDQTVINRLTIKSAVQVQLRVKVAEVARSVINQLGFDWQAIITNAGNFNFGSLVNRAPFTALPIATNNVTSIFQPITIAGQAPNVSSLGFNFTNSHVNANLAIDLLAQEGLVTILAEPNLIAVSGETASFLAGGEFPYPVPQSLGNITIDFKSYGVSLAFTPTVLDGNLITMRVRPEVSELDPTTGINLQGTLVPGILTRRAETTIQLGSGQTFAIAGLMKNTSEATIDALPGLGDIPVLGALFRSNKFKRGDSELVILVTPYIVEPVSGKEMALPTDGLNFATLVEQVFERRLVKPGVKKGQSPSFGPGGTRLLGPAGFSF